MADIGLLVDISDPGGGDRGGALGPLNLRRGRNSLASSHPKTLEVNIKYLDTFLNQSSCLYCYFVTLPRRRMILLDCWTGLKRRGN